MGYAFDVFSASLQRFVKLLLLLSLFAFSMFCFNCLNVESCSLKSSLPPSRHYAQNCSLSVLFLDLRHRRHGQQPELVVWTTFFLLDSYWRNLSLNQTHLCRRSCPSILDLPVWDSGLSGLFDFEHCRLMYVNSLLKNYLCLSEKEREDYVDDAHASKDIWRVRLNLRCLALSGAHLWSSWVLRSPLIFAWTKLSSSLLRCLSSETANNPASCLPKVFLYILCRCSPIGCRGITRRLPYGSGSRIWLQNCKW